MKKSIVLIAVLFLFFSCKKEVVEKPKGLIEKEKMMNIMYDLSLLDGIKYQNNTVRDSIELNPSEYIFKKYKIDSLQFAKSNIYYASNYVEYKDMFDKIIKRLDDKKTVLDSILKKENKAKSKKDSLLLLKEKPALKNDSLLKPYSEDRAIELKRKRKYKAAKVLLNKNAAAVK
ncbi:hypothetical protein HNQ02_000036 [Flavobacterium sp. 7E]|uniref:DUF4296 domain-containing protein n=1 Tax=Flavobacterium sp. 7E TaxID=2735898 RepID=UPI00157022E3|nr:DUF4296 domain-containing protein [Flavobacterium sp. 7E]NRS87136.1 hypothetical protein [Flavobacterium sp. 7E]